ncbi:MAG: hypothetical protein ABI672_19760 [Vicinamibacteria bacterium]
MTYRKLALAVALGGLVVNAGCGGSSSSPTPTATPAPAPVTTTVASGTGVFNRNSTGRITDFTLTAAGTVTATLRWTLATSDLDIWVLSGLTCSSVNVDTDVPQGTGCTILCQDIGTTGTSATCSFSAPAGSYRFWAANYSGTNETGSFTVTVTR